MIRSMPAPGWFKTRQKPSGKFEARWSQPSEKDENVWVARGKSFTTKEQAKQYARIRAVHFQDVKAGLKHAEHTIEFAYTNFQMRPEIQANSHGANEVVLDAFFKRHPIKYVSQLTKELINAEWAWLKLTKPDSPGGQWNVLKTIRAFCKYCATEKWLEKSPFTDDMKLPQSDKEGRALSEKEFDLMISIRTNDPGGNGIASDTWMRRWLILQRYTMTRVSTIFNLTPEDIRNGGTEMLVPAIKHQEKVWAEITHPDALAVIKELLWLAKPGERLFSYWNRLSTMREAFRTKAQNLGLGKMRPHDACKVTEVTALDERGVSLGVISVVSNTSQTTLIRYYLKPDRKRAFDRVRDIYAQTTPRPQTMGFSVLNRRVLDRSATTGATKNEPVIDGEEGYRRSA